MPTFPPSISRAGSSYAVLTLFVVSFLILGFTNKDSIQAPRLETKKKFEFPDFDQILHSRTLSEKEIDLATSDRIIVIGDVHGMNHSLHDLLLQVSYHHDQDILIFAGDVVAKSSHSGSLSTLDFLAENQVTRQSKDHKLTERIYAVRGNHDQLVIQWRSWREWFEKLDVTTLSLEEPDTQQSNPGIKTGLDFLNLVEAEWAMERKRRESDAEEWVDVARKRAEDTWREGWWKRIPPPGKGKHKQEWRMFGDHYWLARDMTKNHAAFFKSLPIVLHIPQYHFFVVHAGLLPSDPRYPPTHSRQPLSHRPKYKYRIAADGDALRKIAGEQDEDDAYRRPPRGLVVAPNYDRLSPRSSSSTEEMRNLQEDAILHDIPQNLNWWNLVNMRGIRKNGEVTRNLEKGTLWAKMWNKQMEKCGGFDNLSPHDTEESEVTRFSTCMPSTVVYGHIASLGLDIRRWTKGLDTGCLYGRRLTALVLTRPSASSIPFDEDLPEDDEDFKHIPFGDEDTGLDARVVSVRCKSVH